MSNMGVSIIVKNDKRVQVYETHMHTIIELQMIRNQVFYMGMHKSVIMDDTG
jgi:hypothetical protein